MSSTSEAEPTEADLAGPTPRRADANFDAQIRGMFDRIAGFYDLMNSAMTAGMHKRWRSRAVELAALEQGSFALDVCCGTGDLAFGLARAVGPHGRIVACDFSERMLEIARAKEPVEPDPAGAEAIGAAPVSFEWADALDLPYAEASFDAVTVGFGARNLVDLDAGLAEMTRVLKPGGRLVVLEITQPEREPLSSFFSLWFDRIVPMLGALAGAREAYTYLPESVKAFPAPDGLAERMQAAGLEQIRWSIIAGGIIAIHSASRSRA